MGKDPLLVTMEFARAERPDDEFAFRFVPQEYHFRARGGGFKAATLEWGPALLEDLDALRKPDSDPAIAQRLGDRLRDFLEPIGWSTEETAILAAVKEGRRVFITIRAGAAELYALPWELLTIEGTGQPIGELAGVVVRYEWPGTKTAPEEPSPRLAGGRILFAWSAAGGAVPAAAHEEAIRRACAAGFWSFEPTRDVLRNATYSALAAALDEAGAGGEPFAVLHLLCHGASKGETFGLSLCGERGGAAQFIDAGQMRRLLAPHAGRVRAVVIAACDSGNTGEIGNHLGSVAQAIHRGGIQSVIASRFPLSVPSSITLAEVLYQKLLAEPASLEDAFIEARTEIAKGSGKLDWAALQLYAREADEQNSRPLVFRPYRGLLSFQAKHSRFFWGRDAERRALRERIEQAADGRAPRLLIVAGASGSGKSSLVSAGVVSDLLEEEGSRWDVVTRRPADKNALSGLVVGLRRIRRGLAPDSRAMSQAAEALTLGASAPEDVVAEALALRREQPDRRLLLFIDQMEEIFTLGWGRELCEIAAQALWDLSRTKACEVIVVCTIRVDFLGRCGEIMVNDGGGRLRLDKVVYDPAHTFFVPLLAADKLGEIIRKPAERVGLEFEAGLVDFILADVAEETTSLPLLQHALNELWQRRRGSCLTQDAYQAMGSFKGALTRAADAVIASMSPEELQQARRLLVRMVNPAEVGGVDTRRRGWTDMLRPGDPAAAEAFDRALGKLVASRLVVAGDEAPEAPEAGAWVELAHDALIRRWERLRMWVAEDREVLEKIAAVRAACDEWTARLGAPHSEDYLLGGEPLSSALALASTHESELEPDLLGFIEASRRAEQADIDARRARQRIRRRWALGFCGALAALSTVCVWFWSDARRAAVEKDRQMKEGEAERRRVADAARLSLVRPYLRQDPTRAAALLREVDRPEQVHGWLDAAIKTASQEIAPVVIEGHEDPVSSIAWSPDGELLVTASEDGKARLFRADGSGDLKVIEHDKPVASARFSPRGDRVVTASKDTKARVFRVDGSGEILELGHDGPVSSAAFSPDGERLATVSLGKVRIHRADFAQRPLVLRHDAPVVSAAWSPGGERIVTASQDGQVRVWSSDRSAEVLVTLPVAGAVLSASFSSDGESVAVVNVGSTLSVWDAREARLTALIQNEDPVRSAVWSPDGQSIAVTSQSGPTRIHRADGLLRIVLEHKGGALSAAWSPDGARVAVALQDNTARVWTPPPLADSVGPGELLSGEPDLTFRYSKPIQLVAWSPGGDRVATASVDGLVRVWSASSTAASTTLRSAGAVRAARVSPDGALVALLATGTGAGGKGSRGSVFRLDMLTLGEREGALTLWERGGEPAEAIEWSPDSKRLLARMGSDEVHIYRADGAGEPAVFRHEERVRAASFSPDGSRFVTASDDHTALIFREDRAEPIFTLWHPGPVLSAAWSPDGARVATGSKDGSARIYTLDKPKPSDPLIIEHGSPVQHVAWSPDGARVATITADDGVRVWSASGEPLRVLRPGRCSADMLWWSPKSARLLLRSVRNAACIVDASLSGEPVVIKHTGAVKWAAWSPDGERVVTACEDDRARLFRASDGVEIAALPEHGDDVLFAAFGPSGGSIITGSADGTARVTPSDVPSLTRLLWEVTTFCVSPADRMRLLGDDEKRAKGDHEECLRKTRGGP